MGRKKSPLNVLTVQKLTKTQGFHAVGGAPGLYLRVEGESRTWVFRHRFGGRRRDMGLGPYVETSLEEIRASVIELRKQVRQGVDPMAERRSALQAVYVASAKKCMNFQACVDAFLESHEESWKNDKHRAQWRSTLESYAVPVFGRLPVSEIDTGLVLRVLEPIWKTKTETATRLRGRIERVLNWATVRGHRTGDNPARWRGHLDALLPKPEKLAKRGHHAALPYTEVAAFMQELEKAEGMGARALQFAILTACRSGEVRGASWSEIDLEGGIWIIPEGRMKAGKEHRVPLVPKVADMLKAMPRLAETDLVFHSAKLQMLSDMTMTAVLKRMGRGDLTAHGFRSTFRDWAGETTAHPREVIEHALAHQLKDKAEAAYARGTLFDKRRRLMADWAAYCYDCTPKGQVTDLAEERKKRSTAA